MYLLIHNCGTVRKLNVQLLLVGLLSRLFRLLLFRLFLLVAAQYLLGVEAFLFIFVLLALLYVSLLCSGFGVVILLILFFFFFGFGLNNFRLRSLFLTFFCRFRFSSRLGFGLAGLYGLSLYFRRFFGFGRLFRNRLYVLALVFFFVLCSRLFNGFLFRFLFCSGKIPHGKVFVKGIHLIVLGKVFQNDVHFFRRKRSRRLLCNIKLFFKKIRKRLTSYPQILGDVVYFKLCLFNCTHRLYTLRFDEF